MLKTVCMQIAMQKANTWYATRRREPSETALDNWFEDKGPKTNREKHQKEWKCERKRKKWYELGRESGSLETTSFGSAEAELVRNSTDCNVSLMSLSLWPRMEARMRRLRCRFEGKLRLMDGRGLTESKGEDWQWRFGGEWDMIRDDAMKGLLCWVNKSLDWLSLLHDLLSVFLVCLVKLIPVFFFFFF